MRQIFQRLSIAAEGGGWLYWRLKDRIEVKESTDHPGKVYLRTRVGVLNDKLEQVSIDAHDIDLVIAGEGGLATA